MSEMEETVAQTGTTAICHLYFSGMCGKETGCTSDVWGSSEAKHSEQYFKFLIYED